MSDTETTNTPEPIAIRLERLIDAKLVEHADRSREIMLLQDVLHELRDRVVPPDLEPVISQFREIQDAAENLRDDLETQKMALKDWAAELKELANTMADKATECDDIETLCGTGIGIVEKLQRPVVK